MYKWLIVFFSLSTVIVSNYLTEACFGCSKHTYKLYSKHIRNIARLSDLRKLNDLALIGTHVSFSYRTTLEEIKSQELNIHQQLMSGIRVFDIPVRPNGNSFELCMSYISLNIDLHRALIPMYKFLYNYPREFIIMNIYQDPDSIMSYNEQFYTNCEIIDYYIKHTYGGRFLTTNWTLEDHIKDHRGKILVATSDESFSGCAFNINQHCLVQKDEMVHKHKKPPHIFNKWDSISNLIKDSQRHFFKCYVNDISFSNGIHTRRAIAKDGGYDFRSQCPRPMNEIMAEKFINPHRGLLLIFVDFVTQNLIDVVHNSNHYHHHHASHHESCNSFQ
ncbi:Protein of unknown function [Cotesia congregata]|uniref:Uncharacterized protein n=1 Tax=Cotesia congregata TaxID=51543 RepID=A0A8J2HGZ7_COTCN|nr:Protein of unknown function [Cotesia congregata]